VKLGSSYMFHHSSVKSNLSLQVGSKKCNTCVKDNIMRAIMAITNKEMGLLHTSKLYEVPKSTVKDKINGKNKILKNC
jgi:hypothetical protein